MGRVAVQDEVRSGWFDPDGSVRVDEGDDWRGGNRYGMASGSQWVDESLYRTKAGRWVLMVDAHRYSDGPTTYRWLDDDSAREWLVRAGREDVLDELLPDTPTERGPGQPQIGAPIKATLPTEHLTIIDGMVAAGEASSRSEAVRMLVARALA